MKRNYLDVKIMGARMAGTTGHPGHQWDPDRYLAYADERGRPFVELLARIGAGTDGDDAVRSVVDLGCGPGQLLPLLTDRWPGAQVLGLDSSPRMIERARRTARRTPLRTPLPGVRLEVADLREWSAEQPVDVLVSNAALQWVPGHLDLLPRLLAQVARGGWFAFQVPGNVDEPSHVLLRELAATAPYAEHTAGVARPSAHGPGTYLEALLGSGYVDHADCWETTYRHVLTGADPVFDWISGTGARPVLEALPADLRASFERAYKAALREAYPPGPHGTVLPFRRVFAVARVARVAR